VNCFICIVIEIQSVHLFKIRKTVNAELGKNVVLQWNYDLQGNGAKDYLYIQRIHLASKKKSYVVFSEHNLKGSRQHLHNMKVRSHSSIFLTIANVSLAINMSEEFCLHQHSSDGMKDNVTCIQLFVYGKFIKPRTY